MAAATDAILALCSLRMFLAGRLFLKSVVIIETEHDLSHYRILVLRSMYWALAWGGDSASDGAARGGRLRYALNALGHHSGHGTPFFASTLSVMTVEEQLQSLPAATESLRIQRDQIVAIWKGKIFPDS
jgi:hypothetical protein